MSKAKQTKRPKCDVIETRLREDLYNPLTGMVEPLRIEFSRRVTKNIFYFKESPKVECTWYRMKGDREIPKWKWTPEMKNAEIEERSELLFKAPVFKLSFFTIFLIVLLISTIVSGLTWYFWDGIQLLWLKAQSLWVKVQALWARYF